MTNMDYSSGYSAGNGRERMYDEDRSRGTDAREQLTRLDQEVRTLVERRPLAAVAGAVLVGFLVGRLIGR
jgi:ElaB/YqjD/DUF883 family membrane-anchored ribosome-binding protein